MEKSNDIGPDRNDPDSVIIKVTNNDIPKESSEFEHILREKLKYIGSGWIGVSPLDLFYINLGRNLLSFPILLNWIIYSL